jgi:phage terminase large subunit-like protein
VIEFATDVVGINLTPWQQWLFIHALELLPDRSFRFRVVVVLVARQNGKSTWSQILALFFMYVMSTALVIGTAQDLDVAEEIWQGAVEIVEGNPELDALKDRVVRTNGKKSLELKSGERWKVKAANRRSGRGLSGDLILLDELREHQAWDAWSAITKTTMARPNALITALSNAGDATSVVLRWLRKMAHANLGDPDGINATDDPSRASGPAAEPHDPDEDVDDLYDVDDDTLGIFEWSAPPGCSMADVDGWAAANPALGYMITERTIASSYRTDPEWVFRTEVLCQWSDGSLEGPFPAGTWEQGMDPESEIVGQVTACVDVSADQARAHIAFAGRRQDGRPHVEVVASRAGHDWVVDWLQDPRRSHLIDGVAVQVRGAPVSGLVEDWTLAGLPVVEWKLADLAAATSTFYGLVRDGDLRHRPQPLLDLAAATASTRPAGDGLWVWDRKRSVVDVAPLVAATGAVWLLHRPGLQGPVDSVYESRGLVML